MKKKFKGKNILIVFIIGYVCYILVGQQMTIKNKKQQLKEYKVQLEKVNKQHDSFVDQTKMAKDYRYIEKLARERLDFIKQGENAVMQKEK